MKTIVELNEKEVKLIKRILSMVNEAVGDSQEVSVESVIEALASKTGNKLTDAKYNVDGHEISVSFGNEEYRVFDSYDAAEQVATAEEFQLLDDMGFDAGVRMENLGNSYKDYLDLAKLSKEEIDMLDDLIADWTDAEEVKQHVDKEYIDWKELAKDIVTADGPTDILALNDGREIELNDGYYAFRVN